MFCLVDLDLGLDLDLELDVVLYAVLMTSYNIHQPLVVVRCLRTVVWGIIIISLYV